MLIFSSFLVPVLISSGITGVAMLALGIMLTAGFTFSGLSTFVYKDRVSVRFRGGFIRRDILMEDIKSVKAVKNKWYYGWGVRYIGNGWMYNVSGFDAVELTLRSGRRFRIGTDKPKELEEAIWKYLPDL